MYKPSRATADAHFNLKQKQNKQAQKEKDKARQARLDRMARLKAQRLSQEAGEAETPDTGKPDTAG